MPSAGPWGLADAKARLSEVLRRSRTTPQIIGQRGERFVVLPEAVWREQTNPKPHMGRWLVRHAPELEEPVAFERADWDVDRRSNGVDQ